MSTVHDRWELAEPLLFAQSLRDPAAFRKGDERRSHGDDLRAIKRDYLLEDHAIASALRLLDDDQHPLTGDEPLHRHITGVAARWLVADGDHWALRLEHREPGHEIIRWRGVTMLLPQSILAAGALAETRGSRPCWVQALPDSIAPREPVGHLHVHLGPLLPFEALWSELRRAFLKNGSLDSRRGKGIDTLKDDALPEIARHPDKRGPGMLWQWILELAFAARVWLALPSSTLPVPRVIDDFGRGRVDLRGRAGALLSLWTSQWRTPARREARLFNNVRVEHDRRKLRARIRGASPGVPNVDELRMSAHGDDEVAFLAECLRRCAREPERYARVFYQYLRVKVALYGRLVVDPWTTGLRHFLDVVKRDGAYTNVIDDDDYLEDLRIDAAWAEKPLRMGAAEVHVHPDGWLKRFPRAPEHRHHWILSFVRTKPPGEREEDKHDRDGVRASRRWRRSASIAATMSRLLARCMAMRPSVLREMRGIGLMDWEQIGPVWLFEPSLRRLIEASERVAAGHPRLGLRPVHTALHLGEDFHHLLSGLRQILEPFEWGLIRRGDRLGHALALGLDPSVWCARQPWVRMRRWDRILDLGFVYWAFERLALPLDAGHIERMRTGAGDAIRRVFQELPRDPLETARDLWLSLPRSPPHGTRGADLGAARQLLGCLLDKPGVGRDALALSLTVETRLDLPVIEAVHAAVHDRVTKAHVAVEVNPSSNLLVGGFRSIFEQPVFHTDDFPIIVNADDPLTFGTTLADDYAYAWAGMVTGSKPTTPRQATHRLEEAARCSMRFRFGEDPREATPDVGARRRGP